MTPDWIASLKPMLEPLWVKILLILAGSVLTSFLVNAVIKRFILRLAGKTENQLDDRIIETARTPISLTIIFMGLAWAMNIRTCRPGPSASRFAS